MTGAGNKRSDYDALLKALSDIASNYGVSGREDIRPRSLEAPVPETGDVPTQAELVPLYESDGRVLYDPIITYPPGTPVVCPGEIMSLEVISYIQGLLADGDRISGVDEEGRIKAGI
jgi:lysine decarboxylase